MHIEFEVRQRNPFAPYTVITAESVPDGYLVVTDHVDGEKAWWVEEFYGRLLSAGDQVAVAALAHRDGSPVTLACRTYGTDPVFAADAVLRI